MLPPRRPPAEERFRESPPFSVLARSLAPLASPTAQKPAGRRRGRRRSHPASEFLGLAGTMSIAAWHIGVCRSGWTIWPVRVRPLREYTGLPADNQAIRRVFRPL